MYNMEENKLAIMQSPYGTDFLIADKELYTEYCYDILNVYFECERNRIIVSGTNHQNLRDTMIDIMKAFAKHKNYQLNTVYLGIYFLDIYMDSYILSSIREHQKLLALVTLLIAAKIEECDDKIPSIKDLLYLVDLSEELGVDLRKKDDYGPKLISAAYKSYLQLYCNLEFMVFETLKFNAVRVTPMTFLSIFQHIAVTESDVQDILSFKDVFIDSINDLKFYIAYHLKVLSDILMYDITFNKFLPSKVASAMIATARKLLNINTTWTLQLEFLTQTSFIEIIPIMNKFLDKMDTIDETMSDESCSFGDSGFHSNETGVEMCITPEHSDEDDCFSHSGKKIKLEF